MYKKVKWNVTKDDEAIIDKNSEICHLFFSSVNLNIKLKP